MSFCAKVSGYLHTLHLLDPHAAVNKASNEQWRKMEEDFFCAYCQPTSRLGMGEADSRSAILSMGLGRNLVVKIESSGVHLETMAFLLVVFTYLNA